MYIVEGNIGVGKSTFLNLVTQHEPSIQTMLEPLTNWTQGAFGPSLLANFYHDPKRWAFTLETLAMICRARDHMRMQKENESSFICERSIYSGHYVFAMNGKKHGYFTGAEWEVYDQWVSFLVEQRCNTPYGFIYLKASPQTCFDRVKKRNRDGEQDLTLEYIKQIDSAHDAFLLDKNSVFENLKTVPVLQINCDIEFENDEEVMSGHVDAIKNFIQKTSLQRAISEVKNAEKGGKQAYKSKVV